MADKSLPSSAKEAIATAAIAAAVAGIPGAFLGPHADVPLIIAAWTILFVVLAADAGEVVSKDVALKVVTSVVTGLAMALGGIKIGTMIFAWSGIGTIPALIFNCGLNAIVTIIFGRAVGIVLHTKDPFDNVQVLARRILQIIVTSLGIPFPDKWA